MILYKKLDIPPIPNEMCSPTTEQLNFISKFESLDYGFEHSLNGVRIVAHGYALFEYNSPELKQWILQYFPGVAGIFWVEIGNPLHDQMIVHTDRNRIGAINYVVDSGGKNVITQFYQEKERDLVRKANDKNLQQSDTGYVRYDDITVVDSIRCQQGHWYFIRTDVLHDVINIEHTRKLISISLYSNEQLDSLGLL